MQRPTNGRVSPHLVTRCDSEHSVADLSWCKGLMEADWRQMAISLTVKERPL